MTTHSTLVSDCYGAKPGRCLWLIERAAATEYQAAHPWQPLGQFVDVPLAEGDGYLVRALIARKGMSTTGWGLANGIGARKARRLVAGQVALTTRQRADLLAQFLATRIDLTEGGD